MRHRFAHLALTSVCAFFPLFVACGSQPPTSGTDETNPPSHGNPTAPNHGTGAGFDGSSKNDGTADAPVSKSLPETSRATPYACTTGYTLDLQQPTTCVPYGASPRCLTCKELPGAGLGGPQDHLFTDSDATASAMVTNSGGGLYRFYGNGDGAAAPFYYATDTDPWYRIAPGTCYYSKTLDIAFHAPEGAAFASSGGGDTNLAVWDQAQGLIVEIYVSLGKGVTRALPPAASCGSTAATACVLPTSFGGGCGVERPFGGAAGTDQDWGPILESFGSGQTIGSTSSGFSAWAGTLRLEELMKGAIHHALSAGYGCANPNVGDKGIVFPATEPNLLSTSCTPGVATGELFFTDYTDAEISAMSAPAWQKVVLTALSHYGTYLYDTGGALKNTISPLGYNYGSEGSEAWAFSHPSCAGSCKTESTACDKCNNPGFFDWLDSQSDVVGGEDIFVWNNVPLVNGKGIENHIHIADPCVAAGMAGAKLGEAGAPAACVGSLWVNLKGPGGDGTGAGTVSSTCSGTDCAPISCVGGFCNLTSNNGQEVTLSPKPSAGHVFAGWSGPCSGTGTCVVKLDGATGVVQAVAIFK
jgi:hypothetical protein